MTETANDERYAYLIEEETWWTGPLLTRYDRWWRMAEGGSEARQRVLGTLTRHVPLDVVLRWRPEEQARALVKLNCACVEVTMSDEDFDRWLRST